MAKLTWRAYGFPFVALGLCGWVPLVLVPVLGSLVAEGDGLVEAQVPQKRDQTREERLYEIRLQEAELALQRARMRRDRSEREYQEAQKLFAEDVIPLPELNESRREYERASLQYEEAGIYQEKMKLYFLRAATNISIVEAKKYRTPDGRRMVQVTLENTSDLGQGMTLNKDLSREQVAALLEIQNLIVSISTAGGQRETEAARPSLEPVPVKEEGKEPTASAPEPPTGGSSQAQGVIVGEPYEIIIPSLKLGERKALTFRLLQDLEEVGVALSFLETQRTTSIMLRKEALQDIPTINSGQFSQEGDLGSRIAFDIILERLAEEEKTFRLAVINLPQEFDFSFIDPATKASLNQVKFTQETTKQSLDLSIAIPEKLSRELVDQNIEFYVFVTDAEAFKSINDLRRKYGEKPFDLEDINQIEGNKVMLELVPRGEGALEILVVKTYEEIKTGQEAVVRVDLFNTGTLPVEEVETVMTPPYQWEAQVSPPVIQKIEPGEKEPIHIAIIPPKELGVGEYDLYVEASGMVGSDKVEAEEKNITIRVTARANIFGNALLIGGVMLLVVGIAVVSIKVSRR